MIVTDKYPKLMVLSIDGVPYGLFEELVASGNMPNLANLAKNNSMRKMRSVQPTVSCVAWSSYMTGKNPGKHGIYGFIDRREGSYGLSFPNSQTMATENIWEILSRAGKRVFGMNVPGTYPPRRVNGILIGGFLAPGLDKIAYPAGETEYLRSIDYRIDSDAGLARRDKRGMIKDLETTLHKRMEAMFHYLDAEQWDFFHTHIMISDRINHFLMTKMEEREPEFSAAFADIYKLIDDYVGKLLDRLPDNCPLMILSDHGFCSIKYEVQMSRYLVETGWCKPADTIQHPLSINPAKSRAYCLIPGRFYVNLAGREPGGIVPLSEYEQTRGELAADLLKLRTVTTGEPVIRKVLMREEIYWPEGAMGPVKMTPEEVASAGGVFGKAADVIAVPYDGYDLKLGLAGDVVFRKTELEGMHTYDDATLITRGIDIPEDESLEIMMLARVILKKLGVEPPADMDGVGGAVTPEI